MTDTDPDEFARTLAAQSLDADDTTGWFERLYVAAEAGETAVPWDRGEPHPLLVEWAGQRRAAAGERALVVGCGLGSDADFLAGLGYATVAFDVSATAVAGARQRYPDSPVDFRTADLFALPPDWQGAFDLVVENMTVQALPVGVRAQATAAVSGTVGPGGTLLVIAFADPGDGGERTGPPWPLTRAEVDAFGPPALRPVAVEEFPSPVNPDVVRWRAQFTRSQHEGDGVDRQPG